jgi:hypothetical protein
MVRRQIRRRNRGVDGHGQRHDSGAPDVDRDLDRTCGEPLYFSLPAAA